MGAMTVTPPADLRYTHAWVCIQTFAMSESDAQFAAESGVLVPRSADLLGIVGPVCYRCEQS